VLAHGRLAAAYTRQLPVVDTPENRGDPFAVRLWRDRLADPARWRQPRMIFVNSMSDLFHVDVPDEYIREIFTVMLAVDWHIYQVLTKRPARAFRWYKKNRDLFTTGAIPSHIWMGTSVESGNVSYRIAQLRSIPATVRFLSCEPLIGPIDLSDRLADIHWVIAGGESGVNHRRMDPSWPEAIRFSCQEQEVPFFFKQWGGRTPKAGGRSLEGRTYDDMPARLQPQELTLLV
jgi:protein gp37